MPVSFTPNASLLDLQSVNSLDTFAPLLGYTPSGLSYILYQIPDTSKYHSFPVAKKGGGQRIINAPIPALKLLQRRLSDLLYACEEGILRAVPHKRKTRMGYQKGKSIYDNAAAHRGNRFVFNVDIEDFFGSINFGRVRGFFISNKDYKLHDKVATIIAQIACIDNALPQGGPSSPILSNLIGSIIDFRLAKLAKASGVYYTRYVDDLTFSTNLPEFPDTIATLDPATGLWAPALALTDAIQNCGFALNPGKSRMQLRVSRQTVTGLTVNRKVSVRREYKDYARAMLHSLATTGSYHRIPSREHGILGFPPEDYNSFETISGIYSHLHYIDDRADRRDDKQKRIQPTSFRRRYRDLLFLKRFMLLRRPLIICEGKTDKIYIKSAIRSLAAQYPELYDSSVPLKKLKVDVFNYTRASLNVLELGGGSGDLQKFLRFYDRHWRRLKRLSVNNPVIFVTDNDDGGKAVFSAIKDINGSTINFASSSPFYHIIHNAYLVKTPKVGSKTQSCIEDLFKKTTLDQRVAGKSFNKEKTQSTATEYGKQIFAEQVVRPNWANIDFTGFVPLLDSISAVIKTYSPIP